MKLSPLEKFTKQNIIDGEYIGDIDCYCRCDENDQEVFIIDSEGIGSSQCTIWYFHDTLDCGSDLDFDAAVSQANEKAKELGYEV